MSKSKTKLMGILNVTPDSFYDGGRHFSFEKAINQGLHLVSQGADILDIGGESTRPGANTISTAEELERVLPVIEELQKKINIPISIDTTKPEVAKKALEKGASWINDVSGFENPAMQELAISSNASLCVMHRQGISATMQLKPHYAQGVIPSLITFFERRLAELLKRGVKESQIILDPGIGFGKTVADNLEILENLPRLKSLGFPLLLGISRKSFLQKILQKPAEKLLAATLTINTLVVAQGIDVIRVHDVEEHRDLLDLIANLKIV